MLNAAVRCALAGVLVLSAGMKLAGPPASQAALATFGIHRPTLRRVAWGAIVVAELALACSIALGSSLAAYGAATVLVVFAAVIAVALWRGQAGAPCACFGSRSRVRGGAIARNLGLAGAFAAVPALPGHDPTTEQWLGLGLALSLIASLGLAIGLLGLAREVGLLRLAQGGRSALEIPEEGPQLGGASAVIDRFEGGSGGRLALAVFVSAGCRVCGEIEDQLALLDDDPAVDLVVFEEQRDADVWRDLAIPGSPFAVALDSDGTVLAKGTFNTMTQLESVLAAAERRAAESVYAPLPG